MLGDGGGPAALLDHRADLLGVDQGFSDIAVIHRRIEGDQAIAVLAIGLKTRAYPLRALAKDLRALRAFDSDFVVDHECPFWNYRGTVWASGLKGVFEPSLKLERDNDVMPAFPALIQIARAKVAAEVSPRFPLGARASRDRRLNNAVTG